MTRRDIYLDATLRHLGAAYYESLHGRATPADVARALDSVEENAGEPSATQPTTGAPIGVPPSAMPTRSAITRPRIAGSVESCIRLFVVLLR